MKTNVEPGDDVYVVLKADVLRKSATYLKDMITVEAVFRSREEAEQEVARRNAACHPDAAMEYWLEESRLRGMA